MFSMRDKVHIKLGDKKGFGSIRGKVKGLDVYVSTVRSQNNDMVREHFGYPNRHLELEWGSFSGELGEYVVPAKYLEKR